MPPVLLWEGRDCPPYGAYWNRTGVREECSRSGDGVKTRLPSVTGVPGLVVLPSPVSGQGKWLW